MPVLFDSFLLPSSPAIPFLIEDKYIRGGMRVVANIGERDALGKGLRKSGMLVWCTAEKKMFQLGSDLNVWEDAQLGGGGSDNLVFISPFTEAEDAEGNRVIGMHSGNRIPKSPAAGYALQSGPNQTLMWVDTRQNADRGTRLVAKYTAQEYIPAGATVSFDLEMARTVMLIDVTLNAVDIEIQAHQTRARNDINPYIFRSADNLFSDQGTTIEDGKVFKHRRHAFLANLDNSVNQFWTMKNLGDEPARPTLTVTYLVMQ